MPAAAPTTFDLISTYVCLADRGGAAAPIEVTADFWATVEDRADLREGRLVAVFRMSEDWRHWEMHPHGEELLVLLSGAIDLVLDDGDGERVVELREGRAFVVPRGAWHRAIVRVPSELLAITAGRGTEHRPR